MKPEVEFITEAIGVLCPNGGSWDGTEVTPVSDPVPTQAELDAQVEIQKAEYDAQEYARNRATEYPAITDQLDEIYHNGIDSWKAVIKVTKDKYPK